jgi:Tfp pilus assembly protein PilE
MEIMIVVTIIGFLAGLAIPSFMKSRRTTQAGRCVNNMGQIESAKEQWSMDTFADAGSPCVSADITVYFKRGFPACPASGAYTVNAVGSNVVCSIYGMHVLAK